MTVGEFIRSKDDEVLARYICVSINALFDSYTLKDIQDKDFFDKVYENTRKALRLSVNNGNYFQ